MRNIFAVKYEKNQVGPAHLDGEHFIVKEIDEAQSALIEGFDKKIKTVNRQVKLPIFILIIYYAAMFLSVAFVLGIIGALQEVDLATAFARGPMLFIGLPFTLIIWAGIAIYKRTRARKLTESEEVKTLQAEAEKIIADSRLQLGIGEDAIKIDTLHFFYEEKDGKKKLKHGLGAQYFNIEMNVYVDDQNFYLADLARVFAFPLSSLKTLTELKNTVSMDIWNKKVPYNSSEYADYKLKTNSMGAIFLRQHYRLTLEINGEEYTILFPPYELKTLTDLTGLNVSQDIVETID